VSWDFVSLGCCVLCLLRLFCGSWVFIFIFIFLVLASLFFVLFGVIVYTSSVL